MAIFPSLLIEYYSEYSEVYTTILRRSWLNIIQHHFKYGFFKIFMKFCFFQTLIIFSTCDNLFF